MSDISQFLIPKGFRFGAVKAGLKASGRTDFALIVADKPANAAAAFTGNRVKAAPVLVDAQHLRSTGGKVRAVAINAGNANCAAGQAGLDAAYATCKAVAEEFGCSPNEVFPSSTGIIGVPLPAEKLIAVLPELSARLGAESDHFQQVAQAILTTDTVEKTAFARFEVEGKEVRIAATCKGSGMIHPQLVPHATMLVYVLTDADASPAVLDDYLRQAIELSFNRISVDGDTSTNDTVLLLASGESGVEIGANHAEFREALNGVCTSLARQVVADGEGISHVVELRIDGAASDADALKVAKAIAHSPLVKTAWAGMRSKLGTTHGGNRLLRRGYRSGAHRYLVRRTSHLPQWRTGRGIRREGRACLPKPGTIFDFHSSESRNGLVRVLDHGSDGGVRPHQCGLFDVERLRLREVA